MSASLCWIAWKSEIAWPNCLRCFGIGKGSLVGALRYTDREGRNRYAAAVENFHGVREPFAAVAQKLLWGQTAIGKNHLTGVAGPHAELVLFASRPKAGCISFNN